MKKKLGSISVLRAWKIMELIIPLTALIAMSILFWQVSWYGGKREGLVAKFESQFIAWSLSNIDYKFPADSRVEAVSFSDSDLRTFPISYQNGLIDATWDSYERAIQHALRLGAGWVFVDWSAPHFLAEKERQDQVQKFLSENDPEKRVFVAVPLSLTPYLDETYKQENRILDSYDCFYEINLYCSYFRTGWDGWIVTKLVKTFAQTDEKSTFLTIYLILFLIFLSIFLIQKV